MKLLAIAAATGVAGIGAAAGALPSDWQPPMVHRPAPRVEPKPVTVVGAEPFVEERSGQHCFDPEVLEGARVALLGAYEGRAPVPIQFAGDGDEVSAISVGADADGPPLLLVLTAYDPVVWDFAGFPVQRLRGVLVYGYHGQGVAHLPSDIPVRFATFKDRQRHTGCGDYAYAYRGGKELDALVERVSATLGREPESFQGAYSPFGLHVERGETSRQVERIDLGRTRVSMPVSRSAVLPGKAGLEQWLSAGAIRPATQADVALVNDEATRRSRSGHLAPFRHVGLRTHNTYAVLRPITVPAGMYGANSANFIVMPGVPAPVDRGSHNDYYFVEDGSCRNC